MCSPKMNCTQKVVTVFNSPTFWVQFILEEDIL